MRRIVLACGCAGLLLFSLACGGGVSTPRGGIDAETGVMSGDSGEAPVKARARKTKSVRPADIPLLTLDGVLPQTPPEQPGQDQAKGQQAPEGAQGSAVQPQAGPPMLGPPFLGSGPGPKGAAASAPAPSAPPKPGTQFPPAAQPPRGGPQATPQASPPSAPQAPAAPVLPSRNLFGVEEDPAVVAERQRQAQEAAQKASEAAQKAAEARRKWQGPPQPPPPPQPPAIPFQFIGYLGPPDDRTGVFSQGGQLIMAKKNDSVLSQFKIVDIGYESAEIGFAGFKETQRIPLSGGGK
jgi:hypothetical protein